MIKFFKKPYCIYYVLKYVQRRQDRNTSKNVNKLHLMNGGMMSDLFFLLFDILSFYKTTIYISCKE